MSATTKVWVRDLGSPSRIPVLRPLSLERSLSSSVRRKPGLARGSSCTARESSGPAAGCPVPETGPQASHGDHLLARLGLQPSRGCGELAGTSTRLSSAEPTSAARPPASTPTWQMHVRPQHASGRKASPGEVRQGGRGHGDRKAARGSLLPELAACQSGLRKHSAESQERSQQYSDESQGHSPRPSQEGHGHPGKQLAVPRAPPSPGPRLCSRRVYRLPEGCEEYGVHMPSGSPRGATAT